MIAFLIAATSTDTNSQSPWFSLVFFGLIFGAMYFMLLRPQRRRVKEAQALQSSIAVNDEILLTSGIYGFVTLVEGDIIWVDIADGHGSERIEVRVARSAVARKVAPSGETDPASK